MDNERKLRMLRVVAVAATVAIALSPPLRAQDVPPPPPSASLAERNLRSFLEVQTKSISAQLNALGNARVEVVVGTLDPRLTLAACAQVEPYLPAGTRLWGKAHIGLRCREGASWNVFLPVDVRVFGPALVAAVPLVSGQAIGPADYRVEEIELSREAVGLVSDAHELEIKVTARAIAAGTPLRNDALRAKPVIAQGDMVRVVFVGTGFAVTSDGKALASAGIGQSVRVQMESGRVVSGTARDSRQVEMR